MADDSSQGYFGQLGLAGSGSDFNRHNFAHRQENGRVRTMMPVMIMKVMPDKDDPISNAPLVHVMPLINQIDGQGNATDHEMIYNIPTTRSQGGDTSFINDPVAGDIGMMSIGDRDMSSLKSTSKKSSPGSFRRHDPADGVYHGPMLNKTKVKRYITPNADGGFDIVDRNGNKISTGAKGVNINGLLIDQKGNLTTPGTIQAGTGTGDAVMLQTHKHDGVQPGGGQTQKPVAGT